MAAHHDLPAAINSNQNTTQDNAVDPSNITTQNGIYVEHNQRLQSFGTWPKNHNINPWKLAEAGFYYQGHKDHVICFSCNVKLCDWEDEEDPWVEHIKFRPECKHVCQKNEENFISAVLVLIKTNSKVTLKMVRDQMDKSHHQSQ
ncbi:Baculoviral IAP repeat-containing protein 7 [Bulinus truncatus]|nr:Baculoviral IAP repeat-containing protein 7 [Bulinus truncatus]